MSAFIVDKAHIAYLVQAAEALARLNRSNFYYYHAKATKQLGQDISRVDLGQLLWSECVASVSYRYEGCSPDELPGEIGAWPYLFDESEGWLWRSFDPVQVIKACHCYAYQSCEHPEWEASEAKTVIDAIESAAVGHLPGYEDAEWGAPAPYSEKVVRL